MPKGALNLQYVDMTAEMKAAIKNEPPPLNAARNRVCPVGIAGLRCTMGKNEFKHAGNWKPHVLLHGVPVSTIHV